VSGNVNSAFTINSGTGQITVTSANVLNYLLLNVYTLRVQVTNSGAGVSLSSTATVTITVLEINKAPSFVASSLTKTVNENIAAGTIIGTITATDPNTHTTPDNRVDPLTYSISDSPFSVNASTGVVSLKSGFILDFETQASFTVPVQVSEQLGFSRRIDWIWHLGHHCLEHQRRSSRFRRDRLCERERHQRHCFYYSRQRRRHNLIEPVLELLYLSL